jgi:protein tyrosine phosphatase
LFFGFSLSLTLIKHRQLDTSIDIKEFLIHINQQSNQKQEHSIIFLTYTKWPMDDNIPNDTKSFLSLIHLAHSYQTNDMPLLIHCNTGVGRTGCTLLISLLLIKMIRGRTLDIYAMAKECRRQRSGVIQTEQQYRYIYECARDALNMAIEHSIMQSAY